MSQKRNIEFEIILQLLREPSHVRALSKKTQQPLTTISRKLSVLVKENILDFKTQGKNKIFSLKKNLLAKNYIYQAEQHKLTTLINKHPKLSIILQDILTKTNERLIILFGSYAKFSAKKESDIDIYIETKKKETKEKVEEINSKIKAKIGEFNLQSNLIKEIIKNHVIVKGVEEFYDKTEFFN